MEISHACGKLYVCTRGFGLCFVLQTNKAVAIRRLQPPPPKITTSVHVIGWRLLFHSTILFSSFHHAYKAKLTKFTLMIQMMRLKLSGGVNMTLKFTSIESRRRWDGQSWCVGIFAIWLTREQTNDYHQFVNSSPQGSEDIQNSLSFQLAIWVIIITDCIKNKHLDQRQKKKTTTAKFGLHYTCNPKCFELHLSGKNLFSMCQF